jgi:hypothetical protein
VAIYYSVSGLTAIFAASVIPIVIMGTSLEVGKLIASVWLKQYWNQAPKLLRGYLISAVAILMLITSMGIFGYLSKAHTDQSLVSGDVQSKIAVYDEKIKTAKDNIEANRKSLKQMDESVDQVMARSTTEGGADKAVAIRRGQAKERSRLQAEIASEQKLIAQQQELRAPIAAEVRKVEAEVGPIKYIAALIYGDNPDDNILEKSVRWVIILIVIVFDPLAVILLLASQYSFDYERKKKKQPVYEADDGPLTDEQIEQIRDSVKDELPTGSVIAKDSLFPETVEEWFDQAHVVAKSIDDGTYQAEAYQPDDNPLTDEQIDQINAMLAENTVVIEHEVDEFPFRGKGIQPSMPLTASYMHPNITEKPVDSLVNVIDESLDDSAESSAEKHQVTVLDSSYLTVDGKTYHHKAYDNQSRNATELAKQISDTYVQNEEQQESDQWSKILNKPITEEEYLEAAKNRQIKKD